MNNPSFICIGAQKAGTTTLQDILAQHPDIYLSPTKEIKYFHRDEHYSKGIKWYLNHFTDALPHQKIGDITPDYILYKDTAKRIFNDLGKDIKIIVLLRNPVSRTFSQFNFHRAAKVEQEDDFKKMIKNYPTLDLENTSFINWFTPSYYIERSLYYNQLKRYYELFPKENIHVAIFEELFGEMREAELERLFHFIGIETISNIKVKHSHATRIPKNNFVSKIIHNLKNSKQILKLFFPRKLYILFRNYIIKLTSKRPEKLDDAFKKELFQVYFEKDVQQLEKLIDRDLSIWR
ncbi:MAG: sulfotransferase domain-containing protein [Flavobacteriales bacterium]|nr:sulfotransferase domain-containing protein [Flavobacteriales bacterium]